MANTARISQSAIEVVTTQNGNARITQDAIEFITGAGIACNNPPVGAQNAAYNHTFAFGGGTPPYTFTITSGSLPPGLTLNAATGVVSGIPTSFGTFPFTVTILDSFGTTSSVNCSIVIASEKIWIKFVGWKLYKDEPCDAPEAVEEAPHVDRAV